MDFLEGLFGRISTWSKQSQNRRRAEFAVEFEECLPSLIALAQGAGGPISNLVVRSFDGFGGVVGDSILLPGNYAPFNDLPLNRGLLLHKAIVGGVHHRLGLSSRARPSSPVQQALELGLLRGRIREAAISIFPSYERWSTPILQQHTANLRHTTLDGADRAWLLIDDLLREEWKNPEYDSSRLLGLEKRIPSRLIRELNRLPARSLAPWCQPVMSTIHAAHSSAYVDARSESSKRKTEKEGKSHGQVELVDLEQEKKKENPVTHSFEKLETADEYSGGYRNENGDDQLLEQEAALDELEMRHVSRGGESSESTYRADISDWVTGRESFSEPEKHQLFLTYPEWDYARRMLKPAHCRLYVDTPDTSSDIDSSDWVASVLEKNQQALDHWKHRLALLVNERRCRDRQWEGSDISVDDLVRYFGDVKNCGIGDPRIYQKNVASHRDFSCLVLLDQSLSTDSWVSNRRVLDVELEALTLISDLLGPFREPVAVAGTWSQTRNRCHFRLYKGFEQSWSCFRDQVRSIQPQGYTRLGPAIRHATEMLIKQGGENRLLILLTDGKPTDFDHYEGRYGIEDIRQACREAARGGVQVRALAVDKEARQTFPQLFGPREYQILQSPDLLPEQLFRIYFESLRR